MPPSHVAISQATVPADKGRSLRGGVDSQVGDTAVSNPLLRNFHEVLSQATTLVCGSDGQLIVGGGWDRGRVSGRKRVWSRDRDGSDKFFALHHHPAFTSRDPPLGIRSGLVRREEPSPFPGVGGIRLVKQGSESFEGIPGSKESRFTCHGALEDESYRSSGSASRGRVRLPYDLGDSRCHSSVSTSRVNAADRHGLPLLPSPLIAEAA
jgi:hypothetical protein